MIQDAESIVRGAGRSSADKLVHRLDYSQQFVLPDSTSFSCVVERENPCKLFGK